MGSEAASGGMERTGVVLSAVDQFSPTVQKYIADLRKVESADRALADKEAALAAQSARAGSSFAMSGEKVVKYGMAASICTGQMQALGVSNEVVARGVGVATDAMTGMLGPVGLVIAAIGAAVAIAISLVNAKKKLKTAINENADALIAQARETGVASESERQMILVHQESTRALLQKAAAELAAVEAGSISLGFWQKVREIFGDTTIRATALAAKEGTLALRIRELNAELADMNLALSGGSKAHDAAAAAAEKHAQAVEAQKKAEAAAALEYMGLLREKVEAQMNADDLTAEGLANTAIAMQYSAGLERNAINMSVTNAQERALRLELIEIRLQRRLKDLRDKAEADIKARRSRSEAEELASAQRVAAFTTQTMEMIGAAVGETAGGNTSAWRRMGIAMISMTAEYVAAEIMMHAMARAALSPLTAAATMAHAAILAGLVRTTAAGVTSYLNTTGQDEESNASGGSGSAPTGPTIVTSGYDPAQRASAMSGGGSSYSGGAFAPVLNLTVQGDASPGSVNLTLRSAQEFLDRNMPAWEARNRRLGRRL